MLLLDIIETFKKSLEHLEWMDDESRAAAAEKVDFPLHLRTQLLTVPYRLMRSA